VAALIYVFERSQMIQGLAARMQKADLKKYSNKIQFGFVPADLDSLTPRSGRGGVRSSARPAVTTKLDSTRVAVTWGRDAGDRADRGADHRRLGCRAWREQHGGAGQPRLRAAALAALPTTTSTTSRST